MKTLISTLNIELSTKNDCGVRSALVLKPADGEIGSRDKNTLYQPQIYFLF